MLKPSQIEGRAEALLRKHGVEGPWVRVRKVAQMLGAVIRSEPFEGEVGLAGALYRSSDRPVIGVNRLDAPVRIRFTIAHEIGHLLLHAEPLHVDTRQNYGVVHTPTGAKSTFQFLRDRVSSQATDDREIEANRFAAALLMPASFLKNDLRRIEMPVSTEEIERFSQRYRVSTQAMTFRLINLGIPIETA